MKNQMLNQAKKELRKVIKGNGCHSGVLKHYLAVNFPSLEKGILDDFIANLFTQYFKSFRI